MKDFDACPNCGGGMTTKSVEKLLRGDVNVAMVTVTADVCEHCGERLYSLDTVRCFERIREKLKRHDISEFQPMGRSFLVSCPTSCSLVSKST